MARQTRRRLFPMHLTPFEYFMYTDDSKDHPKTFIVQLHLSGTLDDVALEAAICDALQRHPLLRAFIRPGKQNRDCWVSAGDAKPVIDWGDLDDPLTFKDGEFIDLRSEIGLRIWIRSNGHRALFTTQFHHCACDGIGSYQFLGDVLQSYAARTDQGNVPEFDESDLSRVRSRGEAGFDPRQFRNQSGGFRDSWREWIRIVARPVSKLKALRGASSDGLLHAEFPGIQSHHFDNQEYQRIRQAARESGQSTNDLILEKLFKTLADWNQQHSRFVSPGGLCVMMPLNLRSESDNDIPAANIVSCAFVYCSHRIIRNPDRLRRSLRAQVDQIKRDRHRLQFTQMLADAQQSHPKLMKLSFAFGGCMASSVLSNTGDPTLAFHYDFPRENGVVKCGNLTIEEVSGVPPMSRTTRVTISIFNYREVLKICMRCHPKYFTADDTRQLLERFAQNLAEVIPSRDASVTE